MQDAHISTKRWMEIFKRFAFARQLVIKKILKTLDKKLRESYTYFFILFVNIWAHRR